MDLPHQTPQNPLTRGHILLEIDALATDPKVPLARRADDLKAIAEAAIGQANRLALLTDQLDPPPLDPRHTI